MLDRPVCTFQRVGLGHATPTTGGARERVLEAASRLFYAEGIHAVGVDRLRDEAGVAKATLYAHFASKEDLVASYLERRSDEWASRTDREIARRAGSPSVAVLCVFDLLGERFRAPGYRGCPFINAAAEFPPPSRVAERVDAHRARVRALFHRLLEDAGVGRPSQPSQLVDTLAMLYDGAMVAAQLDRRLTAADEARSAAAALLGPQV